MYPVVTNTSRFVYWTVPTIFVSREKMVGGDFTSHLVFTVASILRLSMLKALLFPLLSLCLLSLSHSLSLCLIHWSLSLFLHPSLSCLDSNLFGVSISSNRIWIPPAHTVVESSFTGLVWFLTHLLPNIFWVSFRLRLRTYTDLSFQVWSGSSLTLSHYVFSLHLEKCSYITLHLISFGLSNNSTSRSGMLQFILTFESCFFTSKFNN